MNATHTQLPELHLKREDATSTDKTMWFRAARFFQPTVLPCEQTLAMATVLYGIDCDGTFEIGRQTSGTIPESLISELQEFAECLEAVDIDREPPPADYVITIDDQHRFEPWTQAPYAVVRAAPFMVAVYQIEDLDLWLNVMFTHLRPRELRKAKEPLIRRMLDVDFAATMLHEI